MCSMHLAIRRHADAKFASTVPNLSRLRALKTTESATFQPAALHSLEAAALGQPPRLLLPVGPQE